MGETNRGLPSENVVINDELRVIHALRVKGFALAGVIAAAAQVAPNAAQSALDALTASGYANLRDGAIAGYSLTPMGRTRGEELLAEQLDAGGYRESFGTIYASFLKLNRPFLELCTRWQTRTIDNELVVNEHCDMIYDAAVIAELTTIDSLVVPVCRDLHALLNRFEHYEPRFANALAAIHTGNTDWFTKPTIDSYHSVWFELHEDLLATLGITRSQEGHS